MLYTIAPHKPFLLALANWLLADAKGDPTRLTNTLLLLPNRRACRSLRDAFLQASDGKPMLLPRIQPIGDVDGEMFFEAQSMALQPVISSTRRLFLLTQLVLQFEQKRGDTPYNIEQAVQLAKLLAKLIDEVAREGASFADLASLVPEELAAHWQQTLDFLHIISHQWPQILANEEAMDPVAHRNLVLAALVEQWQKQPPPLRIIAAGSTGSQPATARLLAAIDKLPGGVVIVPALDKHMPDKEWQQLSETHPQFALHRLLEVLGATREEVSWLDAGEAEATARAKLLKNIFDTEEATTQWRAPMSHLPEACTGLHYARVANKLDEARIIALRLRQHVQTPAKLAALVTPDRTLARMVAAQLKRHGIEVDDSAGRQLADSPAAVFMRLAADAALEGFTAGSLLALLRHPLSALGMSQGKCRAISRELELLVLRGIRLESGLAVLLEAAQNGKTRSPAVEVLLQKLMELFAPLVELLDAKQASLAQLLNAHVQLCEALATTDEEEGASRLWAGDAGRSLAAHIADVSAQAELIPSLDTHSYLALFEALLGGATYYAQYGLHPRIHIYSPMEARLQHFDLVILAGLNEGSWPAATGADPWMSRPMRGQFGLPAHERHVGQSAHDLYQLCFAPEVLLTCAQKDEGAPTVASRWLVRLQTLVGGHAPELLAAMDVSQHYLALAHSMDAPDGKMKAALRPMPCPPLSARPKRLSISAIDRLLADPYTIYAQYVLRLRKLDELDKEPGASDFGNMVHAALEQFLRLHPRELPANALEVLIECGKEAFAPMLRRPAVACLWWPRFEAMAQWVIEQESKRRDNITEVIAEREGLWKLEVDGYNFTLSARIDRLEVKPAGQVNLIDYKTGQVASEKHILEGRANQLPLGALVVEKGELHPPINGARHMDDLEYWKLGGSRDDCFITQVKAASCMEQAETTLKGLISQLADVNAAFEAQNDSSLMLTYNDYEHLTRRKEWEQQ